jgi:hypothetical protein
LAGKTHGFGPLSVAVEVPIVAGGEARDGASRVLAQLCFSSGGAPTFAPKVAFAGACRLTQVGGRLAVAEIDHVFRMVTFQHFEFFGFVEEFNF